MSGSSSDKGGTSRGAAGGTGTKLQPGVYVAGRKLDMGGPGGLGGHQYTVLVPDQPGAFSDIIDLGGGNRGLVIGAYAVPNPPSDVRLQTSKNASSDTTPLANHLNGSGESLGLEIEMVDISSTGKTVDQMITAIIEAANRYTSEETKRPIHYPDGLGGQLADGCLNSNSFAQSLIEHTVGRGRVKEDFPGYDACNTNRIDASYFVLAAPIAPVPPAAVPTPAPTPAPSPPAPAETTYVVRNGDTLSKIAHRVYGDAKKWKIIHNRNIAKVPNPNYVRPGEKLIIPPK